MISYIYQLQIRRRGKWLPYYAYGQSAPTEYLDLDRAYNDLLLLHSKHSDVRIVKIEIYDIITLS